MKTMRYAWMAAVVAMAGMAFGADYDDGIAAVVSDEVITVYEVLREARPLEAQLARRLSGEQLQNQVAELRSRLARQMVENRLVYEEFQQRGLTLPSDFVERNLDRFVESQAGGNWQRFETMLEEDDMTIREFRERLRQRLAVDVMLDEIVRRPVTVSDDEVTAYYGTHMDEFTRPGRIKLQIIAVARKGRTEDQVQARVAEITKRLADGEGFAAVAKSFSDDVSAERGGEVGWINTRTGKPEFIAAVSGLQAGDVAPVALPDGVFFLRLMESSDPEIVALDDTVRDRVEAHLRQLQQKELYDRFLGELRQKFYVKTFF